MSRRYFKGGFFGMKRALVFFMVVGILLNLSTGYIFSAGPASTKYGDVNGDNNVDSTDYALMRRFLLGSISELPVSNGNVVADVNGDGSIDSTDYAFMRRYVLGLIDTFPAGVTVPSGTDTYQAEDALLYLTLTETVNSGYTGSSYVNYDNVIGSYIEWNVDVPSQGAYDLTFRYANASTLSRRMEIRVNSGVANLGLDFDSTSDWTVWRDKTITVNLNQGRNVIRATAIESEGGPNVDYLKITKSDGTVPPTTVPPIISTPVPGAGARQMEKLDRGVVAVKVNNGVFISWRLLGNDPSDTAFNLYRNGTKVNSSPITGATNYVDSSGNTGSSYTVHPVINGQEQTASKVANVLGQNYLQIPIFAPGSGYSANDCSTGDIDGDGEYEIILKWDPDNAKDNAHAGITGNVYLDAYKLNGTRLWRIDLGKNIRAGAHYTQFMVYDLDGDGKAEVACKTADGTVDGKGKVIGDASKDYRNSEGYILSGPEYLTVFSGQTGEALSTVNYDPPRGTVSSWGDNYGNRVDRFLACIAYLDGTRPSLVMCRGYYTRSVLVAWDYRDGKLTKRWTFDGNNYSGYNGQGNHNLSVADVDGDGKDEIVYGSCTIDDNGKGLYTSNLGHGDAMHLGDINPNRPGLEVWSCLESSPFGGALRDAKTGQIIFRWTGSKDTGRALSADILASSQGEEMWAAGSPLFSATGQNLGSAPSSMNFAIWWDGDELRELLDGTTITKHGGGTLLSATGCSSNNGTKSTPALQADILGDWREEVIFRTSDNKYLRIYTTTHTTTRRIYTLMHDPVYRLGIAWQNVAYNQPPHTSFFLGHGMSAPPVPNIYLR
jgi:rhamnogalacturonan endolyase